MAQDDEAPLGLVKKETCEHGYTHSIAATVISLEG